ncbi:MAG: PKD domain-containing protein [Planctomycetota bacterium]
MPQELGQTLSTSFTPSDTDNYTTASATTTLDVDPAIPVVITSATTASGTQGSAFTYTITATGSDPMTFDASGLPNGLTFSGALISGTPTVTGVFDIMMTASNYAGSTSKILKLVVSKAVGINHAPVFTSSPKASVNPATTATPITLTVSATDEDGDNVDYSWDFGDGTTGTGASVTKNYSAPGAYVVNVVVSDGHMSDTQSIILVITDTQPPGQYVVSKVQISFNFTKPLSDSLALSGTIPIPNGFIPTDKTVRVLIGDLNTTYVLDSKGVSTDKAFALKGKISDQSMAFTYTLKKKSLFTALENLGFTQTQNNPAVDFPVVIVLDGTSNFDHPTINYQVKSNKKGPLSGQGKK